MSTVVIPGQNSYFLGARAYLVEEDKELANETSWAAKHITHNPALKWIIGRYVESDKPNRNRQLFSLADLEMYKPSVKYAPMNLLHIQQKILGAFVETEMCYPNDEAGEPDNQLNPFLEALAVYWKAYFPDELKMIEAAHDNGSLFFSMEAVSKTVTFRDGAAEETFPYRGAKHISYGAWNDHPTAIKQLNDPLFIGGALIIPPVRPGWANADIKEISKYVEEHQELAEKVYSDVADEAGHLDSRTLEDITLRLISKGISLEDENLIKTASKTKDVSEDIGSNVNSDEGGTNMADKIYSEDELKAKVAEAIAPLQAEVESIRSKANEEAVELRVAEVRAEGEAKLEELQKSLDTAVLEAEAAKNQLAETISYLEGEVAAQETAKEMAARREDRLAKVKEVASFPEDYVEANADRWVAMSDDVFTATLEDYKTVKGAKVEDSEVTDPALASTAMKAAAEKKETGVSARRAVLAYRLNGINPRDI